jgi:uncharacterized membrane protein
MEELLKQCAEYVALGIELAGILVVTVGTLQALIPVGQWAFTRRSHAERHEVWLRYAHWLVAGLTFQMAADIVHTAVAPTWDELGRLAAIAVIRAFLTYFLERDIKEEQE